MGQAGVLTSGARWHTRQELITKVTEVLKDSPPLKPNNAAVDLLLAVGRLQVRCLEATEKIRVPFTLDPAGCVQSLHAQKNQSFPSHGGARDQHDMHTQDYVATSGAAPPAGARGYLDGPAIFAPHIDRWIDTSQVDTLEDHL